MKKVVTTVLTIILSIGSLSTLKAQDETVNGNLTVTKRVKWGATGAVLNTDQGASIELRGTGVPYFDFSNDATTDFDMRLILRNNNLLQVTGGDLALTNRLKWGATGAILNTDQGASIELRGTGVPYFDFSNDATTDYDMRLILRNNNLLQVTGGDLGLTNRLRWGSTGAILNTDQGASIELRGTGVPYFDFSNDATTDYDMRLILRDNNTLGVSGGNLAVDGKVKAKEVIVKTNVWADFVFKKEYHLPTLEEVEKHINEYGHLANIPNEKEVITNGISIGKMNSKLLQKIEELTLYIINQNKEIKTLKKENDALTYISERLTVLEEKLATKN